MLHTPLLITAEHLKKLGNPVLQKLLMELLIYQIAGKTKTG